MSVAGVGVAKQVLPNFERHPDDLHYLPDDVLRMIIPLLDVDSAAKLAGVSRIWRQWVPEDHPEINFYRMLNQQQEIDPEEVKIAAEVKEGSGLTLLAEGKILISAKNGLYLAETSAKLHIGDTIIASNDSYFFCCSKWGEHLDKLFITNKTTLQTFPAFALTNHETAKEDGSKYFTFHNNDQYRQHKCRIEACYPIGEDKFILATRGGVIAHCSISENGPICDRWVDFFPGPRYRGFDTELDRITKWGNHLIFSGIGINAERRTWQDYLYDLSSEEALVSDLKLTGLDYFTTTSYVRENHGHLFICDRKSIKCVSQKIEEGNVRAHVEWEYSLPEGSTCVFPERFIVEDKRVAVILSSEKGDDVLIVYDALTGTQVLTQPIVDFESMKFQGDALVVTNAIETPDLAPQVDYSGFAIPSWQRQPRFKYDPTLQIFMLPRSKPFVWTIQKGDCAVMLDKGKGLSILTAGKFLVYETEKFKDRQIKAAQVQAKPEAELQPKLEAVEPAQAKVNDVEAPKQQPEKPAAPMTISSVFQRMVDLVTNVFQAILAWIKQFWAGQKK